MSSFHRQSIERTSAPRSRRRAGLALSVLAAVPLALLGAGQTAVVQAADGNCAPSGNQIQCTFSSTGTEQTWPVPVGTNKVQVTAVGAPGAAVTSPGGMGARVTAAVLLPAGTTTLYVEVGGPARNSSPGGGASDVRTCSTSACPIFAPNPTDPACQNACVSDSRLVVAGGGGAAGYYGCPAATGGQAGDPSVTGPGAGASLCGPGHNGGLGGTAGGAAGSNLGGPGAAFNGLGGPGCSAWIIYGSPPLIAEPTVAIISSPECVEDGGGGGGGYYGGGSGGFSLYYLSPGGGGGAGSSFWVPGATNTTMATDTTGTPSVTIAYTPDTTPPAASPTQSPAVNAAGWNHSDVTVTWNWADNAGGSGIDAANCTNSSTSSGEGVLTLTATCKDLAGNLATAWQPVKVDKTPPLVAITGVTSGATYILGGVPTAGCTTTDALSGVAASATLQLTGGNASGVGTITATCSGARDLAGNTASASATYTVVYAFSGFLAPVNNPLVVNIGKAGKTYPVKFQLTAASGTFISALSAVQSITYVSTSCGTFGSDPTGVLETTATGSSSLRYDTTANQYVYNWATPSTSGCYTLRVLLDSGQLFVAYFNLS